MKKLGQSRTITCSDPRDGFAKAADNGRRRTFLLWCERGGGGHGRSNIRDLGASVTAGKAGTVAPTDV